MDQEMHDLLREAQELMRHQIPTGDVTEIMRRGLRMLVQDQRRRKYAATNRRSVCRRPVPGSRRILADIRRAVRKRDGGQCTFVSDTGQRCPAREFLEFDHVHEIARGGTATPGDIRLRCRAHNQYTAECRFGTGFMSQKRRVAAEARENARSETRAQT